MFACKILFISGVTVLTLYSFKHYCVISLLFAEEQVVFVEFFQPSAGAGICQVIKKDNKATQTWQLKITKGNLY